MLRSTPLDNCRAGLHTGRTMLTGKRCVWCQARRQWQRQSRDGRRRSPSVRSSRCRPALPRGACRGWRYQGTRRGMRRRGVSEGPGARARRRRAVKARTRRSVATKGRPQLCETAARRKRLWPALYERCIRPMCRGILTNVEIVLGEHGHIIRDSICLAWHKLMLDIACSAPAAQTKNRTRYSVGRQDYTPGIRSMCDRTFLINPQQDTFSGYYDGKNS